MFNMAKINRHCDGDGCNVTCVLDIYTTEYDKNLRTNCSKDGFGQLRNENLHTPLFNRYKPYRFTTCKLDEKYSGILQCKGRTTIQDYIPRRYGFSFGYECDVSAKPSLVGLSYNFTISAQSNRTLCLPLPRLPETMEECLGFYNHMSLPNMIGDHDMASLQNSIASFKIYDAFRSRLPTRGCYKHVREVFCRMYFPQCDQTWKGNQMIPLCKETCFILVHSCLEIWRPILYSYFSVQFKKWKKHAHRNISDFLDCNYLPSVNDSISCFYKPVMCDPPPNVTNARIINGFEHDGTYMANFQVEYECVDETFQMEGNSRVTCLYSSEWYKIPKCLKRKGKTLNLLSIVIPLLIALFFVFIITCIARRCVCRGKKSPIARRYVNRKNEKESLLLKRNREYDAFVCYNFDEDRHFVFDSILPELEDNHDPPLKMFIHDRDFTPGREITVNICNAINNCNRAIIVMSQGFIDSPRCREEFTKCLAESEDDHAFKLFIIVMEEVNILVNVPENMNIFFKEKTYLKKDDSNLFEKIGNQLSLIRQHDVLNDNREHAL